MRKFRHGALGIWLGTIIGVHLLSCQRASTSGPAEIVGTDDRHPTANALDEQAVGGFGGPKSIWCTAFAVGPREVATAAHCIDFSFDVHKYRFVTKGAVYQIAGVKQAYKDADVVLLETVTEVGGYYERGDAVDLHAPLRLVSFNLAKFNVLTTERGGLDLARTAPNTGLFLHTLDTVPGASGSPILAGNRIVGIHIGALPALHRNVAVTWSGLAMARVLATYPNFVRESCGEFVDRVVDSAIRARNNPEFRAVTDGLIGGPQNGMALDVGLKVVKEICDALGENSDAAEGNPDDREIVDSAREAGGETMAGRGGEAAAHEPRELHGRLSSLTGTPNREYYLGYVGGVALLTIEQSLGRPASVEELAAAVVHINNGGSLGFLKVAIAGMSTFGKPGNNGTTSCTNFCRAYNLDAGIGSCHQARIVSSDLGVSCEGVPGLLEHGDMLACSCVNDSFEKLGNNGTVSCSTFCNGSRWGKVGTCLNGQRADNGRWVGCESTAGSELKCQCAL